MSASVQKLLETFKHYCSPGSGAAWLTLTRALKTPTDGATPALPSYTRADKDEKYHPVEKKLRNGQIVVAGIFADTARYVNMIEDTIRNSNDVFRLPVFSMKAKNPMLQEHLGDSISLPHRAFDGQFYMCVYNTETAKENWKPKTANEKHLKNNVIPIYTRMRDGNLISGEERMRLLFENFPTTILFGGWFSLDKRYGTSLKIPRTMDGSITGYGAVQAIGKPGGKKGFDLFPEGVETFTYTQLQKTNLLPMCQDEKDMEEYLRSEFDKKTLAEAEKGAKKDSLTFTKIKPSQSGLTSIPPTLDNERYLQCREYEEFANVSFTRLRQALVTDDRDNDPLRRAFLALMSLSAFLGRFETTTDIRSGCSFLPVPDGTKAVLTDITGKDTENSGVFLNHELVMAATKACRDELESRKLLSGFNIEVDFLK